MNWVKAASAARAGCTFHTPTISEQNTRIRHIAGRSDARFTLRSNRGGARCARYGHIRSIHPGGHAGILAFEGAQALFDLPDIITHVISRAANVAQMLENNVVDI